MPPAVFPPRPVRRKMKLAIADLPRVLMLLEERTFGGAGAELGVSITAVKGLLRRNGIDPAEYSKPRGGAPYVKKHTGLVAEANAILEVGWRNFDREMRDRYAEYLISNRNIDYDGFKLMQEAR
jgi:hypothetical protein